jgi:hypothetical protein
VLLANTSGATFAATVNELVELDTVAVDAELMQRSDGASADTYCALCA